MRIAFAGGEGDLALGADGTAYVLDQGARACRAQLRSRPVRLAGTTDVTARVQTCCGRALRERTSTAIRETCGCRSGRRRRVPRARASRPPAPGRASGSGRRRGGRRAVVRTRRYSPSYAGERVREPGACRAARSSARSSSRSPRGSRRDSRRAPRGGQSTKAEFVALVLSPTGLAGSFAIDAAEWAESAALGRFRLAGGTSVPAALDPGRRRGRDLRPGRCEVTAREGSRSFPACWRAWRWRWRSRRPAPARTTRTSRARARTNRFRRAA